MDMCAIHENCSLPHIVYGENVYFNLYSLFYGPYSKQWLFVQYIEYICT